MSDLPTAVWSGEFNLGGYILKCHVLDNGERVLDGESVGRFLAFLEDDDTGSTTDLDAFAKWIRGDD